MRVAASWPVSGHAVGGPFFFALAAHTYNCCAALSLWPHYTAAVANLLPVSAAAARVRAAVARFALAARQRR